MWEFGNGVWDSGGREFGRELWGGRCDAWVGTWGLGDLVMRVMVWRLEAGGWFRVVM